MQMKRRNKKKKKKKRHVGKKGKGEWYAEPKAGNDLRTIKYRKIQKKKKKHNGQGWEPVKAPKVTKAAGEEWKRKREGRKVGGGRKGGGARSRPRTSVNKGK